MACPLAAERIWTEKSLFNDAERKYYEGGNKTVTICNSIQLVHSYPNTKLMRVSLAVSKLIQKTNVIYCINKQFDLTKKINKLIFQ